MLNPTKVVIRAIVECLQAGYRNTYGGIKPDYADVIGWVANIALESLAQSNALYHNVEHTILVTLAGQEILRGKHIREANVSCEDWLNFIVSLLCHDIGYVKGACSQDRADEGWYAKGINDEMMTLPVGATDASFTAYHVDRGKQFIDEHFRVHPLIDTEVVKCNIERTRFPVPADATYQDTTDYPGLARAADLIGQLSDPRYLQKVTALFHEFEEIGLNRQLGYGNPEDVRSGYPNFYRTVVVPYIQDGGLHHLATTEEGRQIIANLYANVSVVERNSLRTLPERIIGQRNQGASASHNA
ncbi:MAG: metal-dependent phosphohydrolase [Cyanothece sp. SIO1E1]|nr:metal-dependent phosphohydrolase [Cyanothece sp. SIO1E1]